MSGGKCHTGRRGYHAGLQLEGLYIMKGDNLFWGGIAGDIKKQTDLIELLSTFQERRPADSHTQDVPSQTWNVQHNLGMTEVPPVTVLDTAGVLTECEIDWPASTNNLLVLRFGIATAGRATVKKV
jgi:hypothetical protein